MATPRSLLVDVTQSGVFHCISRCVRRAFLCGRDPYSGRDYNHRRAWVRDRLLKLTERFAIEVHAYAVMSNHLHVVVRTVPDLAGTWSDEEVARRWIELFAGQRSMPPVDSPSRPTKSAILSLCRDEAKLAACRSRLADLSWFMRCLNEPIARRANHEDDCTGRFWEGRFKCQKLEDEGAMLACMTYVDLNPIRAGMAESPETSDFTSGQDRAVARQARRAADRISAAMEGATRAAQTEQMDRAREESVRDAWLAPIGGTAIPTEAIAAPLRPVDPNPPDFLSVGGTIQPHPHVHDASTALPLVSYMSDEDYLKLLDWTGRQIRAGTRGRVSPRLRPILDRLDLDLEAWLGNVEGYGGLFCRVAGKLHRIRERARVTGQAWLHGKRGARLLYADGAKAA